jgi:hypothetical protein
MVRMAVFDVGETLVDETRYWCEWAEWLKVPKFTFLVVLGAVIASGRHHRDAISFSPVLATSKRLPKGSMRDGGMKFVQMIITRMRGLAWSCCKRADSRWVSPVTNLRNASTVCAELVLKLIW